MVHQAAQEFLSANREDGKYVLLIRDPLHEQNYSHFHDLPEGDA